MLAISDQREVMLSVVAHHKFADFGSAWVVLGSALIPDEFRITSAHSANELYSQFWSMETILNSGVNVVEVKVVR